MIEGAGGALPASREVVQLLRAVRTFRCRRQIGRPGAEIGAELIHLSRARDLIELEISRSAAEFAATDEYEMQGSVSPIDWLRHHCHMGQGTASAHICVGNRLQRLARSVAAVVEGQIGFAHLKLIARTDESISPWRRLDEEKLLEQAGANSVGAFWRIGQHARHVADPECHAVSQKDLHAARRLEMGASDDGMIWLTASLDPVGGAAVRSALEPLARKQGADDQRDWRQRQADALGELALQALDSGRVPQRATVRASPPNHRLAGGSARPAWRGRSRPRVLAANLEPYR